VDIANFNTLDYHQVNQGLDRWAQSSTGQLHDEVEKGRQANAQRIVQAKASTKATVLDAALTQFDPQAGKARMIAVVKVDVTPEGQPPAEKRNRYQADLTRTPDGWKLASLGPVAVG
jgi:Mce-associated membrane protein